MPHEFRSSGILATENTIASAILNDVERPQRALVPPRAPKKTIKPPKTISTAQNKPAKRKAPNKGGTFKVPDIPRPKPATVKKARAPSARSRRASTVPPDMMDVDDPQVTQYIRQKTKTKAPRKTTTPKPTRTSKEKSVSSSPSQQSLNGANLPPTLAAAASVFVQASGSVPTPSQATVTPDESIPLAPAPHSTSHSSRSTKVLDLFC